MSLPRSLSAWLEYIESMHPVEIDMGLDRVRAVFHKLKVQSRLPYAVVIAGTNGKGSTLTAIQQGLSATGLRVGTYTSPHLYIFNERICLDGQYASDNQIVRAFELVEEARGDISLSYFEFTTLAAFVVFADLHLELDAIICEIGLGGRLDAVNVLDGDISAVVSIGLDHQDWLGDTLELIAKEKAGVFREDAINLVGASFSSEVLEGMRSRFDIDQYGAEFGLPIEGAKKSFHCGSKEFQLDCVSNSPLPENNLSIAMQVSLAVLREQDLLSEASALCCAEAIRLTRLEGRMESWSLDGCAQAPLVIADVAHNGAAAQYLATFVRNKHSDKRVTAVFSCLKDKDIRAIVEPMSKVVDHWCISTLEVPRAASVEVLKKTHLEYAADFSVYPSISDAYRGAIALSGANDLVLIFGSFYVLQEIKENHKEG